MPKKQVTDPITDQEIAFARLVLSGTMTDRRAAEAAGLNPDTAAYTKSKPHVRAYMLEHRAAVNEQLVDQDVDLSRLAAQRAMRNSATSTRPATAPGPPLGNRRPRLRKDSRKHVQPGQGPLHHRNHRRPDPGSSRRLRAGKPAHPPVTADIYRAAWLRKQQELSPNGQEAAPEPPSAPGSADPPPPVSPTVDLTKSTDFPGHSSPSETAPWVPRVPGADFVPASRGPFALRMGAWKRRR